MKLKLFLIITVLTGLELIARGPKHLSEAELKKLDLQRQKNRAACEAEQQKSVQWSGAAFDACMKRKNWN